MGQNVDNITPAIHCSGGSIVDIPLKRHLGSASIDTDATPASPAAWDVFCVAVQDGASDSVVHAAGRAAFGTDWYNSHIRDVAGAYASLRAGAARWLRL